LTWAAVDFPNRTLTIADMRKGGRRKTSHVPISDALELVLREALADAGPARPRPDAAVFLAYCSRGGRSREGRGKRQAYTRSGVSTFFARVVAEAGLVDFHFHDLRHDFATRVRRGGAGLDVVQALLGQSTPAMAQRYAHIGRSELARAVDGAAGLEPKATL
jgi:integrase